MGEKISSLFLPRLIELHNEHPCQYYIAASPLYAMSTIQAIAVRPVLFKIILLVLLRVKISVLGCRWPGWKSIAT